MSRRNLVRWVGTLAGLSIVVVLLLHYDLRAVLLPMLHSRPGILLVAVSLFAALQVLNAATPAILLGSRLKGGSQPGITRVFLAMQPVSMIAPGRVSDFGAVPLLRARYPPGAVASAIVLDRVITLFFLLLLAPIAVRSVWPAARSNLLDGVLVVCLVLVISVPFLLSNQKVRGLVNRRLLKRWPRLLRGFGAHMESLLRASRGRLLLNLALTAVKTLLSAAVLQVLAFNFGLDLGLVTTVWMSVLVQLATAVPVSVQGVGVAEGSLVLLFSVNDLPEPLALSMVITARVLLLLVMTSIYVSTTVPLLARRRRGPA